MVEDPGSASEGEEDEDEDEDQVEVVGRGGVVDEVGEEHSMYVYRGLAASPPLTAGGGAEGAGAVLASHGSSAAASPPQGQLPHQLLEPPVATKRSRSHAAELAAAPLHPAKQLSEPSSRSRSRRSSPSADQQRIAQVSARLPLHACTLVTPASDRPYLTDRSLQLTAADRGRRLPTGASY